jgi:putative PEP-CTERM system histidine kinase
MDTSLQISKGIGALSYTIAALAFLVLGALLFVRLKGQPRRIVLPLSCLLTAAWAAILLSQSAWTAPLAFAAAVAEVLRNAGWTLFLLLLLGFFQKEKRPSGYRLNVSVMAMGGFYLAVLLITISVYREHGYPVTAAGFMASTVGRVASAVLGLLLVEQLYRNTRVEQRWGIKFACLGIGGLFAYDFYLYSDAMLFRHVSPEIWAARGVVNALTVPLIAISALRNPGWSLGITVSRRIFFHSAALIGAAIYLLLMAFAGYILRIFGGSGGAVMQVAFLSGTGILLVGILFSGGVRSSLRVFISKHFYTYNYDYREEWLGFTRSLSEDGPGLGERVVQALAKLVESPGGAAFIVREPGHCETVARWNMSINSEQGPENILLCEYLEKKQWVIDLHEYSVNPGRYGHVPIPAWLRNFPRAWLVIPLALHGQLLGFVVLAQSRSTLNLNWEVTDLLKIAGSQAASNLAQQQSANDLMVARQFESFNRMSTFVVHDLKNLVSQLSLLMSNAERHKGNPEFQKDMIETVDFSVQKMKLLLQKLQRSESAGTRVPLLIDDLLRQAVESKFGVEPKPVLSIIDAGLVVVADRDRLERVIGHLIQNAIEASPRAGRVTVSVAMDDEHVVVTIADSGRGMSEEFIRERLFKPFESTKSAGMGIGVFESREYIRELGGQLTVVSRESIGTIFRVMLSLHHVATSPVARLQENRVQEETSERGN